MTEPNPWKPAAPTLVATGLALLVSLCTAIAITSRAVRFFTPDGILPSLFIVQAWMPLIAGAVALRAIALNRRQPQAEYHRMFKVAVNWWFFLLLSAAYAGLGTLDVFG